MAATNPLGRGQEAHLGKRGYSHDSPNRSILVATVAPGMLPLQNMRFTTPLIVITCFSLTAAMKAEDKNLAAFTKAFPDAKVLDGAPEEGSQRYTVSAKISVEDLALRLEKALGAKISVLSAKDPKIFPEAETLKGKDTAILLMGGDGFMCLLTKDHADDESYTASIRKTMEITVSPDSGQGVRPGGRETNFDMRLPTSPKDGEK